MAAHLIDRVDTFCESHVELLSADNVSLLDRLDEHSLKSLVTSLDTSNLLGAFQSSRVDADSLLGHSLTENSTVVQSAVRG